MEVLLSSPMIHDRFAQFRRINVESIRFHVDQNGTSAYLFDYVNARTKCDWRCQNRVAGANSKTDERQMQGRGAGIQRQASRRIHDGSEFFLKAPRPGTRGDPV